VNVPTSLLAHTGVRRIIAAAIISSVWIAAVLTLGGRDIDTPAAPDALATHAAEPPIAAEAQVFRTGLGMLASSDSLRLWRPAHPRTLATWRALRAFPGAPPRIPHGLSASEYRDGACKACHERGGYSARFNAYAPVTPHPEFAQCMQCHLGDASVMGIPLPNSDPGASCNQCHRKGGARATGPATTFRAAAWPEVQGVTVGRSPPPIPHDSPMRVNCLACHAGPAAVAAIRTTHPTRANCRQCHVQRDASTSAVITAVVSGSAAPVGTP
jgi:cytochrome c-type protein NapB